MNQPGRAIGLDRHRLGVLTMRLAVRSYSSEAATAVPRNIPDPRSVLVGLLPAQVRLRDRYRRRPTALAGSGVVPPSKGAGARRADLDAVCRRGRPPVRSRPPAAEIGRASCREGV